MVIIENAPALYTSKGKPVADKLFEIAKANGYSLSLYKTSTHLHGIPQRRDRTFAFAWKSPTAPVLNWYDEERKNFTEYLKEVTDIALYNDEIVNPKIANEGYGLFLKHKLGVDNVRTPLLEAGINTSFKYIQVNDWLEEARDWFASTGNEKYERLTAHAISKFDAGLGIWDGSTHVFGEVMNACVGRNAHDTIHPTLDRSLTVRELMHMMGLPNNFEMINVMRNLPHLFQNVPTCTAASMVAEAVKFCKGELVDSGKDLVRQNNWKQVIDTDDQRKIVHSRKSELKFTSDLTEFITE